MQKTFRKGTYVKYKIEDQDLFDKAFGYIRGYYYPDSGWGLRIV